MSEGGTTSDRAVAPLDELAPVYFAWHAQHELRLQRCADCRRWNHPPLLTCPQCASTNLNWVPVDGRGAVFTWVVTHHPFAPAFADRRPYVSAVIELREGPRILSLLTGIEPSRVRAGLPVIVDFADMPDGRVLAVFVDTQGSD